MNDEDVIIADGTPIDPGDSSDTPPVDEEPVPDIHDEGDRPDVDWDETGVEGDADAQQTFTTQPVPPYRAGDLWENQGSEYVCINGKDEGESFAADDWIPAEATDTTPTTVTRTITIVETITDFSAEALADYQARGAVAYAVYDDGTRTQVPWSSVTEPIPETPEAVADEALELATATNQYFWQRSTDPDNDGAGMGAFVTDEEQDTFLEAAADGFPDTTKPYHNLLMNSLGILLRTAIKNLVSITRSAIAFYDGDGNAASNITALFGKDGFQVGTTGESRMVGDYHSMRMVDAEGGNYFYVSDLRNAEGIATLTETFAVETLVQSAFTVTLDIYDASSVTATVNGTYTRCTVNGKTVTITTPATWGQSVAIAYTTQERNAKAYTFGIDRAGDIGPLSLMEGYANEASGHASHAEGRGTVASGSYAHAEGYESVASGWASHAEGRSATASGWASHANGNNVKAAGNSQTVIGRYNVEDTQDNYAFVVGNGSSSAPSDAFRVGWNGKTEVGALDASGTVKAAAIEATDADITGTLDVGADATFADDVRIDGKTDIGGNLDVTGNATVGGTLDVAGATTHGGTIYVNGANVNNMWMRDEYADADYNGVPSSGANTTRAVGMIDSDDDQLARVTFRQRADGRRCAGLEAHGFNSSGTGVWNAFWAVVDKAGNRSYEMTDPAAFREAIGARSGVVTARSVAAGSSTSVNVTFSPALSAAPNVVCGLQSTQTQLMGNCSCVVTACSATGFTVALVNNSTSSRNLGCYWIAV